MKYCVCPVCKNVIEVVEDHKVPVMCCGKKMEVLTANTAEAAVEKHLPVVNVENGVVNVKVGEVEHPMTEAHYIGFITVKAGNSVLRYDLNVDQAPAASFNLNGYTGLVEVYEYCNLHGLWKTEVTV
ncbi:MAG TPA: desulfoferrodoxin [Firmicutes bacterium]|nr:desulfoferrodoxin [Bacillota bacterium]